MTCEIFVCLGRYSVSARRHCMHTCRDTVRPHPPLYAWRVFITIITSLLAYITGLYIHVAIWWVAVGKPLHSMRDRICNTYSSRWSSHWKKNQSGGFGRSVPSHSRGSLFTLHFSLSHRLLPVSLRCKVAILDRWVATVHRGPLMSQLEFLSISLGCMSLFASV